MSKYVLRLIVLAAIPICVCGQSSQAESVVRLAYARVSFASRISALHELIQKYQLDPPESYVPEDAAKILETQELRIQLANFHFGPISEIAAAPFDSLVTKPSGSVLSLGWGTWNSRTEDGRTVGYRYLSGNWHSAPISNENWKTPFGEVHELLEGAASTRYFVTYEVQVRYQAKQRNYAAMFLSDSEYFDGHLVPVDTILDVTALAGVLDPKISLFPEALFSGDPSMDLEVVREFVEKSTVGSTAPSFAAEVDGLVCDLEAVTCRFAARPAKTGQSILYRRMLESLTPRYAGGGCPCDQWDHVEPKLPQGASANNDHTFSDKYHYGSSGSNGRCDYGYTYGSELCKSRCYAYITNPVHGDDQWVVTACHKTGYATHTGTDGPSTSQTECSAVFAVAARACLFCQCNVTISIGGDLGISFPGDSIWAWSHTYGHDCPPQLPDL